MCVIENLFRFFFFILFQTLQTDLEEAKKQESAKAQSSLEELELRCKETEALLIKEREAAKKVSEIAPVIKEVPVVDNELMEKITSENEKLKVCDLLTGEEQEYVYLRMCSKAMFHFLNGLSYTGDGEFTGNEN